MKTHIGVASAIAIVSIVGAVGLSANPGIATAAADYSAGTQVRPPPSGTISLRDVPDPKKTLVSTKIIDLRGDSIGSVDDVTLDAMGKPTSLKVDVGGFLGIGEKDVALDATALKFDPAKKVLITSMTKAELMALPAIKS